MPDAGNALLGGGGGAALGDYLLPSVSLCL